MVPKGLNHVKYVLHIFEYMEKNVDQTMTIRCKVHNTSIIFGLKIFILPEPVYFLLVHHISKYIEFI